MMLYQDYGVWAGRLGLSFLIIVTIVKQFVSMHDSKSKSMAMGNPPFEDVFPFENVDFILLPC